MNFIRHFAALELHLECDTLWTFHRDRSLVQKSDDAEDFSNDRTASNCVICCGLGHYSSGEFCKSTIGGVGGVVVNMQESVDMHTSIQILHIAHN